MIDEAYMQKCINHQCDEDVTGKSNNIEFSTLDDVELQQSIDNFFLEALLEAGDVGYQKEVNKWNQKKERYIQ
jgi:hypothetical protein